MQTLELVLSPASVTAGFFAGRMLVQTVGFDDMLSEPHLVVILVGGV